MNVREINPGTIGTLGIYIAISIPLTIITAWVIIAFQSRYIFPEDTTLMKRLGWPIYLVRKMIQKEKEAINIRAQEESTEYSMDSKEAVLSQSIY